MITLTTNASNKVKEMMAEENLSNVYLRVGVKPGGCSGYTYGMAFDDEKLDGDAEWDQHGIKVLVDPQSAKLLDGVEIDYKETLMGGGFTIQNPNAVRSCGCGHSFHTAEDEGVPSQC